MGIANRTSDLQRSGRDTRGVKRHTTPAPTTRRVVASRWLMRAILCLSALVGGLLVSPRWSGQVYDTDDSQLGSPSQGNIKAHFDLDVVDPEMTEARRAEAVSRVARVYDFDSKVAATTELHIRKAFTTARDALEANAATTNGTAAAPDVDAINKAVQRFESTLGVTLTTKHAQTLLEKAFAPRFEEALVSLAHDLLSNPLAAQRQALQADLIRGISIQRVPDDGQEPRRMPDISTIPDVQTARAEIPGSVSRFLPQASAAERGLMSSLMHDLVQPNLTANRAATELARELTILSVKPVTIAIKKGEMIIRDGERITPRQLLILRSLNQFTERESPWTIVLGATCLILLIAITLGVVRANSRWGEGLDSRDMLFLSTLFLGSVGGAKVWMLASRGISDSYPSIPIEALAFALPIAAGPMIVRLVLRIKTSAIFAVLTSLSLAMLMRDQSLYAIYGLVGSLLGVAFLSGITARNDVIRAGAFAGLGQAVCAVGILLFTSQPDLSDVVLMASVGLGGGLVASFVALSVTPIIELVFRYTTDLKLLELANLNHPALKELLVEAPGSYHHSVLVGTLVEAAAESIGANSLLTRVMAYYHDLGKGCNAPYFIENQRTDNPHDKLKPSMSAMIIKRHVTDGLEIARRYKLGEPILAGIAEHHGTTLIQYFYHRAKEGASDPSCVTETEYRYPGRKPQTREAALVMIGDSIEAAARTLPEPTPARLQGLVNKIINTKFADGQLDECDLTLKDLHVIAKAFMKVLTSIYHKRIEYPDLTADSNNRKNNGDNGSKQKKASANPDPEAEEDRSDHLRRLGL